MTKKTENGGNFFQNDDFKVIFNFCGKNRVHSWTTNPKYCIPRRNTNFPQNQPKKKKVLCFVGKNEQKRLKNGGNFFFQNDDFEVIFNLC